MNRKLKSTKQVKEFKPTQRMLNVVEESNILEINDVKSQKSSLQWLLKILREAGFSSKKDKQMLEIIHDPDKFFSDKKWDSPDSDK